MLSHHHAHARRSNARSLRAAFFITVGFLGVEVTGALITNSLALLSDALHMLADVLALGIALLATRIAERPPSSRKTYGWFRVEILAALFNGIVLFVLTLVILYKAWGRLQDPVPVQSAGMLVVAGIGLLANLASLWFLSGGTESLNVRGAFLHVLSDALSSVALLAGGGIMLATGWDWIDPALSMAIGAAIVVSAFHLCRESVDVLLEAAPSEIEHVEVSRVLRSVPGVTDVHDLHIWSITSGMTALSGHVRVRPEDIVRTAEILERVKEMLRERFGIEHSTIQVEPEGWAEPGIVHET